MAIIENIKSVFVKAKERISASAYPSQPPQNDIFKAYIPNFLYKPPFGYPLRKNVLQLKDLAKNPFVFSVIKTLKDEASTSKWEIRIKEEFAESMPIEQQKEQKKRISQWFYNPNGNEESFGDIVGQWIVDLCEVDAAVGIKVFNRGGKFSQLYCRDGGSFLKNPDIFGYMGDREEFVWPDYDIVGAEATQSRIKQYSLAYSDKAAYYQYGWTGAALPVPFGRREIMYMMLNPRGDNIYGRSPLEVLYETLLLLVYGIRYPLDFYLNGNTPEGIIHLAGADDEITRAFQARMREKIVTEDEALGTIRKMGHVYPVYGGAEAKFIPFQISAKDMQIIEQQKWFCKLVWACFSITPEEMGYSEDSNRAVSQTMSTVFKRKALRPLLKKIEYAINTQLMPELDASGMFEFGFEDYDIEEDIRRHELYKIQKEIGIKTSEMIAKEEGINVDELKESKKGEREAEPKPFNPFQQQNIQDIKEKGPEPPTPEPEPEQKAYKVPKETKKELNVAESEIGKYLNSVKKQLLDKVK